MVSHLCSFYVLHFHTSCLDNVLSGKGRQGKVLSLFFCSRL